MFEMGYNKKKDALHNEKQTPCMFLFSIINSFLFSSIHSCLFLFIIVLDKVVFAKTKSALGGCVRWILSGSGKQT